jgi:hypothetical protein
MGLKNTFLTEIAECAEERVFVCREVPTNKKLFSPIQGEEWPKPESFLRIWLSETSLIPVEE